MNANFRNWLKNGCRVAAFVGLLSACRAQNVVRIDASAPEIAPVPVMAKLGTDRSPQGHTIGVNSEYLTFDGKPWLPVMGEFHFSRYPAAQWEAEILKMKAAGVGIVSTYVIWIHHEQNEGTFDWSGQKDLRTFTKLCAKHGMYVYPRIGPWAHAEVRNGGLPDWVVKASATRRDDPVYLREVATFYAQIADQLRGLLWKDGGPVIGLQIENEYRNGSADKGAGHIRTLKKMAVADGLDVPLYTVTGWDGAAIPLDAALPVFGGYPDAPWAGVATAMPPGDVFAFRFANRSEGSMGAVGGNGQSSAESYRGTPFLTAEVGDGTEDTYFRRPVVTADDVAAMAPVMLGSGVNLLGYYMFHGGRNPDGGGLTIQESQRTGDATDVPERSYDFQAPLGEFGQERPSLRKLKLVHYFLEDFGAQLAPMQTRAPERVPKNPTDLSVPRVAARTSGESGFVFFNNHVRGAEDRSFPGFQVEMKMPGGVVHVPEEPISLSAGAYGIWPIHLKLGAATLRYGTVQVFKRMQSAGKETYLFFAVPGVAPELMFAAEDSVLQSSARVQQRRSATGLRVRMPADETSMVEMADGTKLVVMPELRAEGLWRGDDPGMLVESKADVFSDGASWTFEAEGDPQFAFGVMGEHGTPTSKQVKVQVNASGGTWVTYAAQVAGVTLHAEVTPVQPAAVRRPYEMGPVLSWRPKALPMAPDATDFAKGAVWSVRVPAIPQREGLADVVLRVRYEGDVARLYADGSLIDDNFWNGVPWEIGLGEVGALSRKAQTLQLKILPLPQTYPMYLENTGLLHFKDGSADSVSSVELVPRYRLKIEIPPK